MQNEIDLIVLLIETHEGRKTANTTSDLLKEMHVAKGMCKWDFRESSGIRRGAPRKVTLMLRFEDV